MISIRAFGFLEQLQDRHGTRKDEFFSRSESIREAIFDKVTGERDRVLEELAESLSAKKLSERLVSPLIGDVVDYARETDWAILDCMVLAACAGRSPESIAKSMTPALLAFLAIRMLDDALDKHDTYKDDYATVRGALRNRYPDQETVDGAHWLLTTMIFAEAMRHTGEEDNYFSCQTLEAMMAEFTNDRAWNAADYREMAVGKMVNYGLLIYQPILNLIDTDSDDALRTFVECGSFVGQLVNDLGDVESDRQRGQPNFWLVEPSPAAEAMLIGELQRMEKFADTAPDDFSYYASARIHDLADYTLRLLGEARPAASA